MGRSVHHRPKSADPSILSKRLSGLSEKKSWEWKVPFFGGEGEEASTSGGDSVRNNNNWAQAIMDVTVDTLEPQLHDPMIQKLFRIFLLFNEDGCEMESTTIDEGDAKWKRVPKHKIHVEEVRFLASRIGQVIYPSDITSSNAVCGGDEEPIGEVKEDSGHSGCCIPCRLAHSLKKPPNSNQDLLTFKEMIGMLGSVFPNKDLTQPAINSVYDQILNQVFKKGFVSKRSSGSIFFGGNSWKTIWCSVVPGRLQLSRLTSEEEMSSSSSSSSGGGNGGGGSHQHQHHHHHYYNHTIGGSNGGSGGGSGKVFDIILNKNCLVSEGNSSDNSNKGGRWIWFLKVNDKLYEFSSPDQLDRRHWITAVTLAITRSESCSNHHKLLFLHRQERRRKQRTHKGHSKGTAVDDLLAVLNQEKRKVAERDLENKLLSEQLAAEQQTSRDEGIVRNLAARMLDEERMRRERLEELHKEQDRLLEQEMAHRKALEDEAMARRREIENLRIQLEEQRLRRSQVEVVQKPNPITVRRSTSKERQDILDNLMKDHESLVEHQNALRCQVTLQTDSTNAFMNQMGDIVHKLMDNTRKNSSNPLINVNRDVLAIERSLDEHSQRQQEEEEQERPGRVMAGPPPILHLQLTQSNSSSGGDGGSTSASSSSSSI